MLFVKIQLKIAKYLCKVIDFLQKHPIAIADFLSSFLKTGMKMVANVDTYYIVNTEEYSKKYSCEIRNLKSNRKGISYACETEDNNFTSRRIEIPLDDLQLYRYSDVSIHHNSDLIINKEKGLIINNYCVNKKSNNYTYVDSVTRGYYNRVISISSESEEKYIPSGIMINGKYSFNYYHSLYENLIRLIVLQEINELIPMEVPLIVDKDMMEIPPLKGVFDKLSKPLNRDVVILQPHRLYRVGCLYALSDVNYLIPNVEDASKVRTEDYSFDEEYIQKLRNEILRYKTNTKFPKKIFISRKSTKRRNFNENDIFDILQPYGFVKLAPETMSFADQLALFNNAEIIVGGSGAAFTNMLFCSNGCRALSLLASPTFASCFNAPAYFNGGRVSYFASQNNNIDIHANFRIDIKTFEKFFKNFIRTIKQSHLKL